jgi:hypothetical protein
MNKMRVQNPQVLEGSLSFAPAYLLGFLCHMFGVHGIPYSHFSDVNMKFFIYLASHCLFNEVHRALLFLRKGI